MNERFSQNSGPRDKNKSIEANAFFDAAEYVKLMRRVSPDDLIMDDEGKITLNLSPKFGFDRVMEETRKKLDLSPGEMGTYLVALEDKIKELLLQ